MAKAKTKKLSLPNILGMAPPELGQEMASPATGLTNEQMATDLKQRKSNIENANRMSNSKQIIQKADLERTKTKFIQELMQMLIDLGIDPSNPESVRKFLENLNTQDPDLAAMFDFAFSTLTGETPAPQPMAGPEMSLPNIQIPGMSQAPQPPM